MAGSQRPSQYTASPTPPRPRHAQHLAPGTTRICCQHLACSPLSYLPGVVPLTPAAAAPSPAPAKAAPPTPPAAAAPTLNFTDSAAALVAGARGTLVHPDEDETGGTWPAAPLLREVPPPAATADAGRVVPAVAKAAAEVAAAAANTLEVDGLACSAAAAGLRPPNVKGMPPPVLELEVAGLAAPGGGLPPKVKAGAAGAAAPPPVDPNTNGTCVCTAGCGPGPEAMPAAAAAAGAGAGSAAAGGMAAAAGAGAGAALHVLALELLPPGGAANTNGTDNGDPALPEIDGAAAVPAIPAVRWSSNFISFSIDSTAASARPGPPASACCGGVAAATGAARGGAAAAAVSAALAGSGMSRAALIITSAQEPLSMSFSTSMRVVGAALISSTARAATDRAVASAAAEAEPPVSARPRISA